MSSMPACCLLSSPNPHFPPGCPTELPMDWAVLQKKKLERARQLRFEFGVERDSMISILVYNSDISISIYYILQYIIHKIALCYKAIIYHNIY